MRHISTGLPRITVAILLIAGFFLAPTTQSRAEDCPVYDFKTIFMDEFYPDLRWNVDNGQPIRWTTDITDIEGTPIARPFTADQSAWLDIAFNSWDMASDKITFKRVGPGQDFDVKVGLAVLPDPNNHGFWNIAKRGSFRGSGAVRLNAISKYIVDKEYFLEVAQSEIGNLLGLGDISDLLPVDSVMMDPDLPPWGSYPLSDYDIGLMRQFYGESTCKSTWPAELKTLKDRIAKLAEDEARAKADAEARAKAEADARAKAEAELAARLAAEAAKPTATPTPVKTTAKKRTTITCVKGKLVKKVTAVNPKCPSGYKKR